MGVLGPVDRLIEHADRLTATERRIAEVLAHEPQIIAFGTVAQVAGRAGTSGPSVVRLAVKLGYHGFVELQADVQQELARQLAPARDRIRQRPPSNLLEQVGEAEADNINQTLAGVDGDAFGRVVDLLADRRRHVWVLPGDVTFPVGLTLSTQLDQLREDVTLLTGSAVAVARRLAGLAAGDTVMVVDIRRYERSLVEMVRLARDRSAQIVVLTDSPLSPLAGMAGETFFVAAKGVGPFDSMTGALALAHALVAATAAGLRRSATARLDAIELAWHDAAALVAEPGAPTGSDGRRGQPVHQARRAPVSPGAGPTR
jgi:DNA-binding MurR/RpiR family transcriptional regulator